MNRRNFDALLIIRGVILALVTVVFVRDTVAQNHPLMNGPIRSEDTSRFNVEMIRTAISLSPAVGSIPGMSFVHVTSESSAPGTLSLNAEGFLVSRISMHGYVLDWHQNENLLTIDLPERSGIPSTSSEWLIKVEFLIGKGLSFRTSAKGRIAIWDGSEPGSDVWYPTPIDQTDSFLIQLRVSIPNFWEVWVGGDNDQNIHPERMVDGYSKREVFAGSVSFLAFDTRQSHLNDFDIPVIIGQTDGIEAFLADFAIDRTYVTTYLEQAGLTNSDGLFAAALVEGIEYPVSIGYKLLATPEYWVSHDPWSDQFRSFKTIVSGLIHSRFDSIPPTDAWLSAAITNWVSLQVMSQAIGEDASGLIYEKLRDDYLLEAKSYRRPLVWDRWEYPSDMLDEHANGKGVWVLRMLTERIGEGAMTESVVRFLDQAANQVVDTESFRDILELISGENLGQFFDVWVYSAGHPQLTVSYVFQAANETTLVTIEQDQVGSLIPDAFEFDLSFQYSSLDGINTSMVRIKDRKQTAVIKTSLLPRYVFPDAFATVLLDYSVPHKQDDLVAELRDVKGPVPKIRSLRHLSRSSPDPAVLLGLRSLLQQETDPAVLASACEMLGEMAPSNSALSFLIGFSSHPDARVRLSAIRALSLFPDAESAFSAALNAANTDSKTVVLSEAVSTLIKMRPNLSWSLIQSALVTPSDGDLVARTALDLIQTGITEDRNMFGAIRPLIGAENAISLRIAAFWAFARIDAAGQTVNNTIEEWLKADEIQLRKAALSALFTYPEIKSNRGSLQSQLAIETSPQIRRQLSKLLK